MNIFFPVTYSILSVEFLEKDVLSNYNIGTIDEIKFLNRGLNDTFLIRTKKNEKYVLRVYRRGWRTLPNILYEIDVLIYLASNGIPVSKPLPQNNGRIIQTIRAPEGNRHIVLFTYAKGRDPSYETKTDNNAYNYGKAVAKIHNTVQNFTSEHLRFELNLEYLLYTPLKSIKPMLSQREKDWSYLRKLVEKIYRQFERLQIKELEQGFCHGDFHGGNAHFSDDGTITFFDFDCCGWGFRAYDIAVFRWGARLKKKEKELWEPFLQGYTQERNLKKIDLEAVPLFICIRHIWLLGLHTGNGHDFGFGWMDDSYFDRAIAFFRKWDNEFTADCS